MKTVTVDDYHRIRLPNARPRSKLAYEEAGGVITLTPLVPQEPPPAKVRLVRKQGYSVLVSDRPVNMEAVKELLAEFP